MLAINKLYKGDNLAILSNIDDNNIDTMWCGS